MSSEATEPDEPASAPAPGEARAESTAGPTDERPPFAAAYPRDPELDRLVAYFARGNHRAVREGAEALARKAQDPEVAAAARALRSRLDPDPIARVLLLATLALLVTLTTWAVHRSNQFRAAPPPPRTVQTIVK